MRDGDRNPGHCPVVRARRSLGGTGRLRYTHGVVSASQPSSRRVRVLPIHVANQIAAGEVIERPASVVKELVENAIDAGASRVEVSATAGGRKLIAVTDDGCGMVRDDALLAVERHATSKIRTAEDIVRIHSLGFRGEALASIAAVSRFLLRTRHVTEEAGTEVEVVGGSLRDVRDSGSPVGTTLEVRDLFFNLPGRRKFLRTYVTEQGHVRTQCTVQALAHPGVGMTLRCDGQTVLQLPPCGCFLDRLRDLYGADNLDALRPAEAVVEGVRVHGYVGLPTWTRSDRAEQHLFVNHRPAAAPLIHHALREAYPPLDGNRKPVVFLFIDLDPEAVDVNVHPTKREVRFRRPAAVRDALIAAVSRALERPARAGVAAAQSVGPAAVAPPRPAGVDRPDDAAFAPGGGQARAAVFGPRAPAPAAPRLRPEQSLPLDLPAVVLPTAAPRRPPAADPGSPAETARPRPDDALPAPDGAPWIWCRLLGSLGERYVLLETDDGFVVLDPHAAHARVLYEQLLDRDRHHRRHSQRLLLPQSVELRSADAARVRSQLAIFEAMGFGIEALDADSFLVDALPDVLGETPVAGLLVDAAQAIAEAGPRRGREHWREEAIANAAAQAAVRARRSLDPVALLRLVEDLGRCRMPYTCPRGKPTMIFTSYRELARRFGL